MKPSPLEYLDIPADWPKEGTLPDGRTIALKEAWQKGSYAALASIEVDVPGEGRIKPWMNAFDLHDFVLSDGTEGLLSREELEASGFKDSTLEAWAKDKHQIALDLSGEDIPDVQHIRADAYRRFLAETEW